MTHCKAGFHPPHEQEHLISSKFVSQVYRIKILRPMSRADDTERFPVLYVTDSDELFGGFANLATMLQTHGEVRRFILVGIGYENPHSAPLLRMRDFHTHATRSLFMTETRQLADSSLAAGVDDLKTITHTTDALEFLRFIREELMPYVEALYPVLPGENSYCGFSAGGGFGLYTLFTKPETFKRYILSSPTTSYGGHHFGIELARAFIGSGSRINAKVFISVGELEEFKRGFTQFDLVTGYYLLAKFLQKSALPGLDLKLQVFPGETHATAWILAFSHGVRVLFGPPDQVPFWPDFLK